MRAKSVARRFDAALSSCTLVTKQLFIPLLAAALFAGCNPPDASKGGKKDGKGAPTLPTRAVTAAPAESRPMERAVFVIGALAAIDQATLSVKVTGRLQSLSVDLGTRVKRGELVAQIESVDYELKLRSAEALLAQARARLGLLLVGSDDTVKAEETSTVRQANASLESGSLRHTEPATTLWRATLSSPSTSSTRPVFVSDSTSLPVAKVCKTSKLPLVL